MFNKKYPSIEELSAKDNGTILVCPICDDKVFYRKKISQIKENGIIDETYRFKCYNCNKIVIPVERVSKLGWKIKPKKSVFNEIDLITEKELIILIEGIEVSKKNDRSIRDKAFISFLYLTGCRVSEVLGSHKLNLLGVKKKQISKVIFENKEFLEIENLPILKCKLNNGVIPRKSVIIPLYDDLDNEIVKYILNYIDYLEYDDILFKFARRNALNIAKKVGKTRYPHYFRHLRATHLRKKGLSSEGVKRYFGWADSNTQKIYEHLDKTDLASQMIKEMRIIKNG